MDKGGLIKGESTDENKQYGCESLVPGLRPNVVCRGEVTRLYAWFEWCYHDSFDHQYAYKFSCATVIFIF